MYGHFKREGSTGCRDVLLAYLKGVSISQWWLSGDSKLKWSLEHAMIRFNEVLQRENGILHVISMRYQQQFVQILLLLVQHHNPIKTAVTSVSTLFCHLSALMNLVGLSQLTSLSGLWSLCFSHATPSHFTGQLSFCASS